MVLPNLHGENVRFTGTRSPEQPFGEQPPFDFHANDSSRRGMICIENSERKREREREKGSERNEKELLWKVYEKHDDKNVTTSQRSTTDWAPFEIEAVHFAQLRVASVIFVAGHDVILPYHRVPILLAPCGRPQVDHDVFSSYECSATFSYRFSSNFRKPAECKAPYKPLFELDASVVVGMSCECLQSGLVCLTGYTLDLCYFLFKHTRGITVVRGRIR